MFSSSQESGSPSERAKMYTEVSQQDQQDHHEEKTSSEYTELYGDYRVLQQRVRNLKLWIYSLASLLALSFVLLLFSVGASSSALSKTVWKPTPVPHMPTHYVTFDQDDRFANNSNEDSDLAWQSLMPQGDGFIIVQDPEQYELQPGKNSSKGPMYDITVFHQLHCLKHIRTYLYTILELAQPNSTYEDGVEIFLQRQDEHVFHCFDYIRQGLMCNADMTVEWPREEANGARFAVDGWGIQHQCKSWDSVMKYMEENRFHQPWEEQ